MNIGHIIVKLSHLEIWDSFIDSSLTTTYFNTCRAAFVNLSQINIVHKFLITDATKTLYLILITVILFSLVPLHLVEKLQQIQNSTTASNSHL